MLVELTAPLDKLHKITETPTTNPVQLAGWVRVDAAGDERLHHLLYPLSPILLAVHCVCVFGSQQTYITHITLMHPRTWLDTRDSLPHTLHNSSCLVTKDAGEQTWLLHG